MATKVEIAFNLAPNGVGNWFTLDDTVKGKLDNTTYLLSGDLLVDVTGYLRSLAIKRGRSRQLEKFTAGTSQVVLDNRARVFDPQNTSSPYYGNIGPRKQLRVSRDGVNLYTGNIEDWDFSYDKGNDSVAIPKAVDGFANIAKALVTSGTQTSELSSVRVGKILDDAGWPSTDRSISTGAATLNADFIAEKTTALTYLQKVELSEAGAFFVNPSGAMTFKSHTDLETYTNAATFGPGNIPFTDVSVQFGMEALWNTINVTYYGGTVVAGTASAIGTASVASYGEMAVTYDTLLNDAAAASDLATWLVGKYQDPLWRVNQLTVALDSLTAAQQAQVLGLDLGTVVKVVWQPNNTGSTITQYVTIDGIEHKAVPQFHEITFTLSETQAAFLLDDAVFGRLDFNNLGY